MSSRAMEVTADPRIGASFGPYVLERQLGEGGMGTVYAAVHSRTGRRYAVKLLRAETRGSRVQQQGLARFRREARALSSLRHTNVVAIHDFEVTPQGEPYLVMDLLEGETLSERMDRRGALQWTEALRYFDEIASALRALHAIGVVHRDVKPSNVLLSRVAGSDERAVLVDFGLAKELASDATAVTAPDTALGTPVYMAPEQARGEEVDERTDVYALGIVLYEMIAGRPPFVGPTPTAVLAQTLVDPPPPLTSMTDAPLPAGIDEVVARALAKAPADRYEGAAELARAVRALSGASEGPRTGPLVASGVPATRAFPASGPRAPMRVPRRAWPWIAGGAAALAASIAWVLLPAAPEPPDGPAVAAVEPAPVVVAGPLLEPLAPRELEREPTGEAPPSGEALAALPRDPPADGARSTDAGRSADAAPRSVRARGARHASRAGPRASASPPAGAPAPGASPPPAPASAGVSSAASSDPLARAREAASRREWTACVAALASQPTIARQALDVFLICADRAHDRSALERGCRELDRLLLFDHAWHRRCQAEILGGGRNTPSPPPSPALSGDDRAEHDAQQLRQRGDFAGCARALESVQRSYSGLMMRLDCAELSRDSALLRRACRRYIDARIPAQTRFNPLCESVLRAAAASP